MAEDHPITVAPNPARVTVTFAGTAIADSRRALTLREASYAPVQYIPRADIAMDRLLRTAHHTHCPYKGDASYFTIRGADGTRAENAAWSYEDPLPGVAAIRDHIAFYPDRVKIEVA